MKTLIARPFWRAYFVLFVALALTAGATYFVAHLAHQEDRTRFSGLAEQTRSQIDARLNTYVALLRGGAGLFAAIDVQKRGDSADVQRYLIGRQAFARYVQRLRVREEYPGIQGVGFTVRVPAAQQARFLSAVRREYPQFAFKPDVPGDRHAIVYLEPQDERNAVAIGFNMFSEAMRREAMQRAMESGDAAASGKVILVQEITPDKQNGFLIYVPVYRAGASLRTIAERRAALMGFVYAPFRAGDLLRGVVSEETRRQLAFRLYDTTEHTPERLLYQSDSAAPNPAFTQRTFIERAGRKWGLDIESRPEFASDTSSGLVPFIAVSGLFISAILFAVTWTQARAYDEAHRTAAELRESEKKRSELLESERSARVQAEAANRMKDEFLATVSHELRTPLTAILGWANLARSNEMGAEGTQRALETIERNAKAQAQLVEDLLDMSRIISGKLRLDTRPLYLSAVLDTALDAVRPAAQAKGIELVRDYQPGMGRVHGDQDRLQQVVWNLLSNAIKFTPKGGRVALQMREFEGFVEIAVCDSGIGMEPEFAPFAFDRFRQADSTTTRKHGGLGLGLSIVRHLVEMHGGEAHAFSEGEGKGSTFTVRLPLLEVPALAEDEPQLHGPTSAPTVQISGKPLSNCKLLIVEDEADARDLIRTTLEMHGAQVQSAASAAQALALATVWRPDALISDIGLPGEDGYSLIKRLRALPVEQGGATPAIALTAFARERDREAAFAAGFQKHLSKPVAPAELVQTIVALCAKNS
jgi:signal transduction histidine kinase/ActR/RegA family two-component response regulator